MTKCKKFFEVLTFYLIMIITLTSCNDRCNHIWSDATCDNPRVCTICKEVDGEKLGHLYVNGVCTRCSKMDEDYVSPLISPKLE